MALLYLRFAQSAQSNPIQSDLLGGMPTITLCLDGLCTLKKLNLGLVGASRFYRYAKDGGFVCADLGRCRPHRSLFHIGHAKAISTGCAAVNADTVLNGPYDFLAGPGIEAFGGPQILSFRAGETLVGSLNVDPASATLSEMSISNFDTAATLINFQALIGTSASASFTFQSDETLKLSANVFGFASQASKGIASFQCVAESTTQTSANAAARGAITQTAGLISGRIQTFNGRAPDGNRRTQLGSIVKPTGLLDLSVGRDGALGNNDSTGNAAGYTPSPWGVWANFSWSGVNDTSTTAGVQGNVVTGIAGADYEVSDGFIVGGAISIGGAAFDSQTTAFDTDEVSFGINPYFAYQITDLISVDAIAGYSYGSGESTRAQTITGQYGIHRYYVASNASYFQSWDRFALLASGGIVWGQSFESAYTGSDQTRVSSRQADLGSLKVLVQPSYLFDLNPETGLFLEPYLVGEYSYDFKITEIAGHNNDRDEFRLGLGMNVFSGRSISGNLEGSTTVGREDQRIISVLGTLRYAF